MTRGLMPSVGYVLRWVGWGVQWLVIGPLTTLALAGMVLAWQGGGSPGQALVQYVESVSTSSASGVWFYAQCAPGSPLYRRPPARKRRRMQPDTRPILTGRWRICSGFPGSRSRCCMPVSPG